MSKHLFANEKIMKQYLGALLTEEVEPAPTETLAPVAKLLEQVTPLDVKAPAEEDTQTQQDTALDIDTQADSRTHIRMRSDVPSKTAEALVTEAKNSPKVDVHVDVEPDIAPTMTVDPATEDLQAQILAKATISTKEAYMDGEFQALFFDVAGLTLAVPLKSLGGIHQLTEITPLFAKPKWFKGVMLNREEKLNVVDTARWVMPEKYNKKLEEALNYQYLITLGDSNWGLLAEGLVNNLTLHGDDVKWREQNGKRPWLAGVIKEIMCALIDVGSLIELLEQGLDSQAD